jgi:hypothetical protein
MPHVCRLRAILTGPAVIDHQHPAAMRRGRRIRQQQLRPSRVDRLRSPPGLGQTLNYRMLCPGDRLCLASAVSVLFRSRGTSSLPGIPGTPAAAPASQPVINRAA